MFSSKKFSAYDVALILEFIVPVVTSDSTLNAICSFLERFQLFLSSVGISLTWSLHDRWVIVKSDDFASRYDWQV